MPLPTWATQKLGPLPVWGWAGLSVAGGVGYVLYKRRQTPSTAPTLATGAQAVPSSYPQADTSGAGGGGSAGGGASDNSTGGISALLPDLATFTSQPAPSSTVSTAPSPLPAAPSTPSVQIAPSLLGGGYIASQGVLQNPVASVMPTSTYTPSPTDIATTQPGGIQTIQAGLPGTQPSQGLTYSIYGTNTGTGPIVPASQRKPGERYDINGRVIA